MKLIFKLIDISDIKRISFRQDITGLRAIAVLAVVFYHAEIELFKGGWLGVDIFFVISGYLISNIIISELNEGTFTFKNFYLRRVRRILPALFSMLLLTIPFGYFLLTPKAIEEYVNSMIASVFFYANYYFQNLDFYVAESTKVMPLLHTWSLAIEEQYYLLFPLFAFITYKYYKKYFAFLMGFLTIGSIYINTLSQDIEKFYKIEFRIWELLIGVLVMIISNNVKIKHLEKIGILMIFIPIFYFDDSWINQIEPKLIALTGISLVIFSNSKLTVLTKILTLKPFTIIGLSSYSIYLLHQPFFSFIRIYLRGRLLKLEFKHTFLSILLVIILGYISYLYIEKKFSQKESLKFLFVPFIIILIFSILVVLNNGFSSRYNDGYSALDTYSSEFQRGGKISSDCIVEFNFSHKLGCGLNYSRENKNLILIGDSHLLTIAKALKDAIPGEEFNFFTVFEQGCPFVVPIKNNLSRANCPSEKKGEVVEDLLLSGDSIIIFGGRMPWYFNGKAFETDLGTSGDNINPGNNDLLIGLKENIEFLSKNSQSLIIVYPIPELGYYPLEVYVNGYLNINDEITYDYDYWKEYSNEVNSLLENISLPNIERIKSDQYFCDSYFSNSCTSSYNGVFFYWADDHLTRDGASLLVTNILDLIY